MPVENKSVKTFQKNIICNCKLEQDCFCQKLSNESNRMIEGVGKVQVGKDQEKAQSEKNIPTPKTEVGKPQTNNQVLI